MPGAQGPQRPAGHEGPGSFGFYCDPAVNLPRVQLPPHAPPRLPQGLLQRGGRARRPGKVSEPGGRSPADVVSHPGLLSTKPWDVFVVVQISELSDLVDRPLVAALSSRLQALHAHLQAFMEQVDSLVKRPAARKGSAEEGGCPPATNGSPLPCSGDIVDTVERKVNTLLFVFISSEIYSDYFFLMMKVQSLIACWLNSNTNAHPDRCFVWNSGAWIYTTQSNLKRCQLPAAPNSLRSVSFPRPLRDGVSIESLNEPNTLQCLLAQMCGDLSCSCKYLPPGLPMTSAWFFLSDLAFLCWFWPRMEPDVCVDSGKSLQTFNSLFTCIGKNN